MLETILKDSSFQVESLGQVSRDNFSIIPHALVRDSKVSPLAKIVFLALDARIGQKHSQRVLEKTLAEDLNSSLRSVSRALKELREAGYLKTYRTGRSNRYELINPSRVKYGGSDTPNMAVLQINNSLINKQNSGAVDVDEDTREETAKKANYEGIVLKTITAETKVYVQANSKTKALCDRAYRLGENPHFYALKVSKHFLAEKKKRQIRREAGFLVSVSMKTILEADEPLQVEEKTPMPPKFNPEEQLELCTKHESFGSLKNSCPLCKAETKENKLSSEKGSTLENNLLRIDEGLFKID